MPHVLIFESDVFNIRLQRHKDTKLFLKLYSFEYTESAIKKKYSSQSISGVKGKNHDVTRLRSRNSNSFLINFFFLLALK